MKAPQTNHSICFRKPQSAG